MACCFTYWREWFITALFWATAFTAVETYNHCSMGVAAVAVMVVAALAMTILMVDVCGVDDADGGRAHARFMLLAVVAGFVEVVFAISMVYRSRGEPSMAVACMAVILQMAICANILYLLWCGCAPEAAPAPAPEAAPVPVLADEPLPTYVSQLGGQRESQV